MSKNQAGSFLPIGHRPPILFTDSALNVVDPDFSLASSTQCFKDNLDLTPMSTFPAWFFPPVPAFCIREHQEAQRVSRRSLAWPHESKGRKVGCLCPPPKLYVDHSGLLSINLLWPLCFLCLVMVKPCLLPASAGSSSAAETNICAQSFTAH